MKTVWIILIVFLAGCSVTKPYVSEYTLAPKLENKDYLSKMCKEKSLKIGQVFSSNSLMSHKMKYITDEYQEFAFTQSEWARSPNRLISDELIKGIRSSGLFFNVNSFKSRAKTDLLLETHVEKFIQYFDNNSEKSYVEVVITLNLINMKKSKSISHATFNSKLDTLSVDAKGGVVALNSALSNVLLKTNDWLEDVCR